MTYYTESFAIRHMLGYITPEQWADAWVNGDLDDKELMRLMKDQEQMYKFQLVPDVMEIVKERLKDKFKR